MKNRHVAALSLCAALALPFAANASGVWHQTNTEIGYAIAPEHATAGKSRARVESELAQAKADPGKWFLAYRNLGTPGWYKQGTSRTREDALSEVRAMTPQERARLNDIYTPGWSPHVGNLSIRCAARAVQRPRADWPLPGRPISLKSPSGAAWRSHGTPLPRNP